jgi:hypothetical protein
MSSSCGFRLDVPRHRQIDDEHRRVLTGLDRAFEHAFAQIGKELAVDVTMMSNRAGARAARSG